MSAGTTALPLHPTARLGRFRQTDFARILPLLLLFLLFFDVPLVLTLGWSLRDPEGGGGLTIGNYVEFAQSPLYLPVVWRTFAMAGVVTAASAVLGYPLALWMSRLTAARQVVAIGFVVVPFWISILVRTYAWIVILGNGGLLNRWLKDLELTTAPVSFIYNEFGVAVGMVNVLLPYLVLPLYAAMLRVDKRLLHVAATLGASQGEILWRVFFPITVPALTAAMVLVFILSLGFYITPAILGGGKVPMVANMMDFMINRYPHWELAAAISVCLLLMTLAFYSVYQWVRAKAVA